MGGEDKTMNEEEEFRTPQVEKKQKRRKEIATETEHENEDNKITVRVKQIRERSDRISPIVAYFSTGYDPCAVNPITGEKVNETPKVTVYKHQDEKKKRLQVVVSPPSANVEFVGTNFTGEQASMQTTAYAIGILNRENKTMRILPVAHNKIIRLEPRIKLQELIEEEASVSAVDSEHSNISMRDQLNRTNTIFGTRDAASRDKKKRALHMGDNTETQKLLDGKLNELDVNTAALESTSAIVARNIPPYDASATTPKKAYPLEKIIENAEWNFLQDIYRLLEHETEAATDSYPVFVRNRLYKLRDMKDDTEKQTICGVLMLLTHMVKFKDMNSMHYASAKDHRFPEIIRRKLQSLFKDSESERMPVDKINLLISYVLVLSLHVDNFKTDPEDIAKDLRTSTISLRTHFENLGCKVAKEKSTTVATLRTPLTFPQIRGRRKSRK